MGRITLDLQLIPTRENHVNDGIPKLLIGKGQFWNSYHILYKFAKLILLITSDNRITKRLLFENNMQENNRGFLK